MNKDLKGWLGNDKERYIDFCLAASENDELFSNFKQNPDYTSILEHVSESLGREYYNLLSADTRKLIPEASETNDKVGNPTLITVEEGQISATTLRYLKVLQDLGEVSGNIVEIGAGYGGQARLIMNFNKVKSYKAIDLHAPSLIQNKYNKDISAFKSIGFEDLKTVKPDLVISNYAFAELNKEIQQIYLEKVILNAKHGYITYNPGANWEYSYEDLFEILKDKNVKTEPDYPMVSQGYPQNLIIRW